MRAITIYGKAQKLRLDFMRSSSQLISARRFADVNILYCERAKVRATATAALGTVREERVDRKSFDLKSNQLDGEYLKKSVGVEAVWYQEHNLSRKQHKSKPLTGIIITIIKLHTLY